MNIHHFIRSIADARALLSFCSMARFTALGPPTLFDWADCWDYDTPSLSCLWLTRGLLPAHLTAFLKQYFLLSVIYKTISPLLNDFQVKLYGEIWLCRNVLFHAWEESQGISAASKLRGPSLNSSSIISSLQIHNSPLATVSQDSWISWISSSIIWDITPNNFVEDWKLDDPSILFDK
ncbi:hypothetical protein RhiirA1_458670 [Rhizophagus irregularis]|uniref:Uncharacterized protein n=1 Tax=Rhizophagus irregularis TaxID=588596 RepID=A0A2N0RVC1_9GLOM|nr:hypothetical protein RhiirA1_458670 [Rhizophagus irregularis]